MKSGVPFDVAFSLPRAKRRAWAVVMGELDGGKFNWQRFEFEEQR